MKIKPNTLPSDDVFCLFDEGNGDWRTGDRYQSTVPLTRLRGAEWAKFVEPHQFKTVPVPLDWHIQCQIFGSEKLHGCVFIDRDMRGGVAVLTGTRFPVSQVLAQLAETSGPDEVADNFDLNAEQIRDLLDGLALILDKPLRP